MMAYQIWHWIKLFWPHIVTARQDWSRVIKWRYIWSKNAALFTTGQRYTIDKHNRRAITVWFTLTNPLTDVRNIISARQPDRWGLVFLRYGTISPDEHCNMSQDSVLISKQQAPTTHRHCLMSAEQRRQLRCTLTQSTDWLIKHIMFNAADTVIYNPMFTNVHSATKKHIFKVISQLEYKSAQHNSFQLPLRIILTACSKQFEQHNWTYPTTCSHTSINKQKQKITIDTVHRLTIKQI